MEGGIIKADKKWKKNKNGIKCQEKTRILWKDKKEKKKKTGKKSGLSTGIQGFVYSMWLWKEGLYTYYCKERTM